MPKRSRETRRKITSDFLLTETGVSKSTLAKMSNDRVQFISVKALDQLCIFFGCQPSDLFIEIGDP